MTPFKHLVELNPDFSAILMFTLLTIFRLAEMREELPSAMDELPAAGPQEGPLFQAGRGPHRFSPQCPRQQVSQRHTFRVILMYRSQIVINYVIT